MILMDLSRAAAKLHCSERWLADNLRSGRFPAKKIGRKWILGDDDIATILKICSVTPAAFSADIALCAAPSSSITKTTLRRLQQSSHPGNAFLSAPATAMAAAPTHPTTTAVNARGDRTREMSVTINDYVAAAREFIRS
jgi:hypothetical protein